ncbi:MAG: protein translocase subunit SecD [Heliobacteriaceae bacterium]|jgi:preprotein translocase subunit SecD|nr:protein translocase subunit SecD [Heliobacteriaceae bacterium]
MKNKIIMFWAIVVITIISAAVIAVKPTKLGLDLVGGSRLVLEAETGGEIAKITPEVMQRLQFAIENRVNKLGVAETVVQQAGEKRLIIEIPNVTDLKEAKAFIGDTAQLEFKKEGTDASGAPVWVSTGLTGQDLSKSILSTDQTGHWVVSLEFNAAGSKKFADLTKTLVGQQMAIFFDGDLQSAPVIREAIYGGKAQISGGDSGFEYADAQRMVNLLNAGALPVPAKVVEENTVGPTLGADSIEKSKFAGLAGIGLVMLFMIAYYRVPGLIADIALVIYSLILFALFKVIPVTLTLAGIAGFILSIGMAVDANILIFERTKEELRSGRNLFTAINSGFDRAFTSIFDSNMTTIITCIILYCLGTSIVKGFALTLVLGVVVSMFSAITITKNFMHLIFGTGELKYPGMFGLKKEDIGAGYTAAETKREKAKFGVLD